MPQSDRAKRKQKVIDALNKARALELRAIPQYMNQHYNLDDMDYGDMAANIKLIAIDEMRHAEMFAERIKELDGEPTAEPAGKVERGQKVEDVFSFDANLEDDAIEMYNQFMNLCLENNDGQSAKLFEAIINDEQLHYNYFDNINEHIEKLGNTYLAQVAGTPSATGLAPQGFAVRKGGGATA